MAFDSLTEKLQNVFKNLRSKGRLTEDDVKTALREVKMALLDVYKRQIQGRMYEEIASLIGQAIRRTILEENAMKMGDALSSEELNLLLFRWEVSKESDNPRPVGELKELLAYCERHCTDQEELTKVYPYVALLLAKYGECAVEELSLIHI